MAAPSARRRPLLLIAALAAALLPLAVSAVVQPAPTPAPAAAAQDPLAKPFRQAAALSVKTFRALARATVGFARTELAEVLARFDAGEIDAAQALEQAVVSAMQKRLALSNGAAQGALDLVDAGRDLLGLPGEGPLLAGKDFQAGGCGTWDRTLLLLQRQRDASDRRVRRELERFVGAFDELAAGQGDGLDPRVWYGAIDGRLWDAIGAVGVDYETEDLVVRPAQVLVAATIVVAGENHTSVAGMAFDRTVALSLAYPGGTQAVVLPVLSTTFRGSFSDGPAQGGVLDVVVNGQLAAGPTQSFRASLPATSGAAETAELAKIAESAEGAAITEGAEVATSAEGTRAADLAPILEEFRRRLRQEASFLGGRAAGAGRQLRAVLAGLAKQHAQQAVATTSILDQGFGALQGAVSEAAFFLAPALTGPVSEAEAALQAAGLTAADVPADFTPDGMGLYARFLERVQRRLDALDRRAARAFGAFVRRVLARAAQRGEQIDASFVAGRPAHLDGEVLALPPDPAPGVLFQPAMKNGLIVLRIEDGETLVTGFLGGLADSSQLDALVADVNVQGGDVIAPGDLSTNAVSGEFRVQLPVLAELPLLGHLFRADGPSSRDNGLLFLVTPQITGEP